MDDSPDEKEEEEEQQLVYVSATPSDDVLSTNEQRTPDRNSMPTSEDMREQALANLNRAVFVRENVHSKQLEMFNVMVQSLVHE